METATNPTPSPDSSTAPVFSCPNWIADRNRYKLPTPPTWALKKLYDWDPLLVIVPSRNKPVQGEGPQYLLTRRAVRSAGLGKEALMENQHPDTWMCQEHGLVPIAPLRWKSKDRTWRERDVDLFIEELKARDQWKFKTGDEAADAVEAFEAAAEQKRRADFRDTIYHMARDAWRSMAARAGWRNKR
jgi:hypothetical protein